jgi:hypothetical protein
VTGCASSTTGPGRFESLAAAPEDKVVVREGGLRIGTCFLHRIDEARRPHLITMDRLALSP